MGTGRKKGPGGGGNPLNFKVVGNPQPASPKENTIWLNTDVKIKSKHFGVDEPNVYNIQLNAPNDQWYLIAPHSLQEGDIINFTIPATVSQIFEAIRIYDTVTDKQYCVRQGNGSAAAAWPAGTKVSVRISNVTHQIGDWVGHGTAFIMGWGYYHHEEGAVWVTIGTNSQAAFNALKKDTIMVYPLSAKQYVNGAWVDVEAKSWQDGQWVDWAVYLYCAGEEYEDITGGWFTYNWQNRNTLTLTRHETHLNAEYSDAAYGQGWLSTAKNIDLTDIDTIYLTYVLSNGSANVYFVAATAQIGAFEGTSVTTAVPAFLKLPGGRADKNTVALDVSGLSGSYYVKIGGPNGEYHGMGHVEVDIYSISLAR